MSTPRMKELRQRRTRKKKIAFLRKHYAVTSSDAERTKILEKVQRISTITREQFLKPMEATNKHRAPGKSATKA